MIARGTPVDTGRWLRWAHLGTTITVVIFLWGEYQAYNRARDEMSARVAKMEVQLEALRNVVEQRHAEDAQRLNIQREDIRALQDALGRHFDRFPAQRTQ